MISIHERSQEFARPLTRLAIRESYFVLDEPSAIFAAVFRIPEILIDRLFQLIRIEYYSPRSGLAEPLVGRPFSNLG